MMTTGDMELVREYARHQSEEAFATLVSRHVNLVYSVALRQLGDPHLAEEVTQATFIILARKAASLGPATILSAWLCRTAQYTANRALRTQRRRQAREQESYMQSSQTESESSPWSDIAPLLDVAMAHLGEKDHSAIVLRFFEGKDLKQVGAALGVSENAAKTRVSRAVEKLRKFFGKRGVVSTTAIIAGVISANSAQAAPAALASSTTAVAVAKGVAATGSTLILVQGTLKLMAWAKAKTAAVIGAIALLTATGTAVVTVRTIAYYQEDLVWRQITAADQQHLNTAPPIVSIRPSKLDPKFGTAWISNGRKQMAFNKSMGKVLQNAYQIREPRITYSGKLPPGAYDYIVSVPDHQFQAFQAAIKNKFGLVGRKEMRDTDVLILKVAKPDAPGFKPAPEQRAINLNNTSAGHFEIKNEPMSNISHSLELYLKTPLIDETGLTGRYDADLTWDATEQDYKPEALKQAIRDQLGFELVPDHRTIEMLVVEKVK